MINPEPLLSFLERAVGSPYVYGGTGKACSPDYRRARGLQYPAYASAIKAACPVLSGRLDSCIRCRYAGKGCYDCAQLVKKALGLMGLRLPSGASSQWKAESLWACQGALGPEAGRQLCVVFRRDEDGSRERPMQHVGISLGDGYVVDARSHRAGVIKTRLTAYPWTHMAFPKGFALPGSLGEGQSAHELLLPQLQTGVQAWQAVPLQERALEAGMAGEAVRLLQSQLLRLGYHLPRYGADGRYGRETCRAVVAFQRVAGLAPTGQAGLETMALLFPKPKPRLEEEADENFEFEGEETI